MTFVSGNFHNRKLFCTSPLFFWQQNFIWFISLTIRKESLFSKYKYSITTIFYRIVLHTKKTTSLNKQTTWKMNIQKIVNKNSPANTSCTCNPLVTPLYLIVIYLFATLFFTLSLHIFHVIISSRVYFFSVNVVVVFFYFANKFHE